MNVILLTIFVGFVLVGFFVALFLASRRDAEQTSPEHDSLLPLEEESFRAASKSPRHSDTPHR